VLLGFGQRSPQFPKGCLELSGAAAASGIGGRKLRTCRVFPTGSHEVVCFNRKREAPKAFRAPRGHACEPFVGGRCRGALQACDSGVNLHVHARPVFGVVSRCL